MSVDVRVRMTLETSQGRTRQPTLDMRILQSAINLFERSIAGRVRLRRESRESLVLVSASNMVVLEGTWPRSVVDVGGNLTFMGADIKLPTNGPQPSRLPQSQPCIKWATGSL
jgi:hypothetical protein